jgi:beta-N-acetylhexosaminidase
MKSAKIKIGLAIIIILTIFLTTLFILNYKSLSLTNKINELRALGLDTKNFESKNNIASLLQGKTASIESEVEEKIKNTLVSNQLELADNRDEMIRILGILNKYNPSPITFKEYTNLTDQRYDLSQYKNQLSELIISRVTNKLPINQLWNLSYKEIISSITNSKIEDLVSQIMVVGIDGQYLDSDYLDKLREFNPGGIILMGKNVQSEDQVKQLTSQLNSIKNNYPLLITTDQEGGVVKRITWDTTTAVDKWANISKEELCNEATSRAKLLTNLGINNNLAPVSDLSYSNSNAFINNRTINPDSNKVSTVLNDYVNCYQLHNSATLKHFPGHGMVTGDSHIIIPSNNTITKEQWTESHAIPFKNNLNTDMILTGHIIINQVDTKPASMSDKWLNQILRQELKYNGVIITDDMNQYKNISNEDMSQSAINALVAGNDMLLYVPSFETLEEVKQSLIKYYSTNRQALEAKVRRVLLLKARF